MPIHSITQLIDENNLSDQDLQVIKPFLDWTRTSVISSTKKTDIVQFAGYFGFLTGAVGVYAFFPLGGDFANLASDFLDIKHKVAREALYLFFATSSIIPMTALAGLSTKINFENIVSQKLEHVLMVKNNSAIARKVLYSSAYILGSFAAICPVYVTCEVLGDSPLWLKISMSIPAYLGGFMYKIDAETRLLDRAFDACSKGETDNVIAYRAKLKSSIHLSMNRLSSISDEEVDRLYQEVIINVYSEQHQLTVDQETIIKLQLLFSLCSSESPQNQLPPSSNNFWSNANSLLGFITGAMSAYTYFALGVAASLIIASWINIHDPQNNVFSKFMASLIVIPWGALGAEATMKRFEQIYHSLCDGTNTPVAEQSYKSIRKVISVYSIFGGTFAAIPLTYLAIQATKTMPFALQITLVITAFLGPAAVRTNAINAAFNKLVNWWVYKYEGETNQFKRDQLIKVITTISSAIDKLPDDQITSLQEIIFADSETIPTNIDGSYQIISEVSPLINERDRTAPSREIGSYGTGTISQVSQTMFNSNHTAHVDTAAVALSTTIV